jgi:hypothetical protein
MFQTQCFGNYVSLVNHKGSSPVRPHNYWFTVWDYVCEVKESCSCPRHEGVEVQLHSFLTLVLVRFTFKKEPRYTMNRLDGPQSPLGRFGEENPLLPLPGFDPWLVQPVAKVFLTATLSRFSCVSNGFNKPYGFYLMTETDLISETCVNESKTMDVVRNNKVWFIVIHARNIWFIVIHARNKVDCRNYK